MLPETDHPELTPEEMMLQQAVEAIRQEHYAQARDILTKLLRTDQQNPDYWVWLSAAMESQKERLYCLQTAYKMDPTNAAARRGLVLMGALPPDENQTPFPMNHPRPWEAKVKLNEEQNKPSAIKQMTSSPGFRLSAAIGVIVLLLVAGAIAFGVFFTRTQYVAVGLTGTPRPTVTPYATNSGQAGLPATQRPLFELLSTPYTPTPIYAATPHGEVASDSYKAAMRAYKSGQWDMVAIMMAQVATAQPGSADALYFVGEANRLSGKYQEALDAYNQAIQVNANFAPSYLGRALTNIAANTPKTVMDDFDKAISLDGQYAEAYLQRGMYLYAKKDYPNAIADLQQADSISPSPLAELTMARVLLSQGENEAALEMAIKANEKDVTMLEGYLVLGDAYRATGQIDKAVDLLETYLKYQPDNAEAFAILGAAYYNRGEYETALKDLQQAIRLDKNNLDAYYWLGMTSLAQKNYDTAMASFRTLMQMDPESFDAGEGLAKAYMGKGEYNNSYIAIIKVEGLIKTDEQRGRFLYIRALSLDELNQTDAAYRDWSELLTLPSGAITDEMRTKAQERQVALRSPTPPPPTATVTRTPTPTPTKLPSKTPVPTDTRVPSVTPKK